ncbi:MAG: patatin-like phospholipase family protein [Thermodesulfovibrionales bacterium]
MKRVLSIDGGGIRGIIPAMTLAELERITNRKTSSLFDLIAGTSTGGILACALAAPNPMPAREIIGLYLQEGPEIFERSGIGRLGTGFGLFGPKYTGKQLQASLREYLGHARLTDCAPEVLVTAYDIERRQPHFFKSHKARKHEDRDCSLVEVAAATASAPTYFPPCKVDSGGYSAALIDGGVYATNPAMCALVEAMTLWPGEEIMLVSLGTGELTRPMPYEDAKGWGLAKWATRILDAVFDGASDTVSYQCAQILGDRFTRIQCSLTVASDDMDDASEENLRLLQLQAEQLISANRSALGALGLKLFKGDK